MSASATAQLRQLEKIKTHFDEGLAEQKLIRLKVLEKSRLASAAGVLRLHETLCFMRAYPDNAEVFHQVKGMLARFAARQDLKRHRHALVNSGISGTVIEFSFFADSAMWLARNWGSQLNVDWETFENTDKLEALLPMLVVYPETPALDEMPFEVQAWIKVLKHADETDAGFFLSRMEQADLGQTREMLLDGLDLPLQLLPGDKTPARTREHYRDSALSFQTGPLNRSRPNMPQDGMRPPLAVHDLNPREGRQLIDLARSCMATRSRDIDAIAYGDARDVRIVDCGNGLQLMWNGVIPERRLMFETLYGFVVLNNGVPLGYGAATCLFNSCEIAFTIFDTFRSGETAHVYGWTIANIHHLFGADTIMKDPYQLGQDNDDALASGAWWFYQKLGYRPRKKSLLQLMRRELRAMKQRPSHRSSLTTLKTLASANAYLHLGQQRDDVLGELPLANVSLQVTHYLAKHFGADRRRAEQVCSKQAAQRLGIKTMRGFSAGERLMWRRWAPLVMILPELERWPVADRKALATLIRAKGGRRESEYTQRFDAHKRLRSALIQLSKL